MIDPSHCCCRGPSYAAVAALCLVLASGCGRAPEAPERSPSEQAAADSVVALIGRVDRDALRQAFSGLSSQVHTRRIRTEQYDASGDVLAYAERVLRSEPGGTRIVRADSSGTFDYGYLRRFVASDTQAGPPSDLVDYVMPDDPAYASPRMMEAYRYSVGDTTLSGRPVRIIRVRARAQFQEEQSIQAADLYLEPSTERMVGVYLERSDDALWFREESTLFVRIERLASGRWVPAETRFDTRIDLPFRSIQRFASETVYSEFTDAAGA